MFVYLNGAFVPAAEARVSVFDGGYMYGDGIYTTLRVYAGLPLDLDAHHERLARQTAALCIAFDLTPNDLRAASDELVARNGLAGTDGRLRITVSRAGDPLCPLPLHGLEQWATTVVMTLAAVAPELARWQETGIGVICLDQSYARGNFPALKTLNGLATVSALRRAAAAGCPEALLTGADGRLLEGAVSNLFLVGGDHLVTPACEADFLPGRTRERILKIAAGEDLPVREKVVDRRHLAAACEIFVVSSVREVLPVIAVDGVPAGGGAPGPVTRLMQERYRALIARDLRRS